MYKLIISCNDVIKSLSSNHKIVNKGAVKRAYAYAEKKHKGQFRKTGEPYIMHPLRVAKFIADWGFESDVVSAALMHDIVEDCNTTVEEIQKQFGSGIADMVNTLTAVNNELHKAQGLTKQEIDNLSDAHLIRTMSDKALFIKIADRLDNLNTIEGVNEAKQFGKAQHTREILIPLVMKEGAYQLVDLLEELCFKIEHKDRYHEITTLYKKIRLENSITTQKMIHLFKELFSNASSLLPKELLPYQDCIVDFISNPRSTISIFRQLSQRAQNLNKELPKLLNKNNVALYDLTLVLDDAVSDPLDIFYKYYEAVLLDKEIYILDFCTTTYGDSNYLLLCDNMDNRYRFFIKTEEEHMKYRLGNIINTDTNLAFVDVNDIDPRDAYKNKIKVFRKDGSECFIDEGATVLDFAFAVHSELGLHFKYAMIDNSKTQLPAYTRLNEGDMITIITSDEKQAQISWFNYLKTSKAVHHLVRYFMTKDE